MTGARQRLSWSDFAVKLAVTASSMSQDPYVQVGAAVLRPDHTVAGLGFNGPPRGIDIDWNNRNLRRPLVVHAEQNALRNSTPRDVEFGILASTHRPCAACTAIIAGYGIRQVFYLHENDPSTYDAEELDRIANTFGMNIQQRKEI